MIGRKKKPSAEQEQIAAITKRSKLAEAALEEMAKASSGALSISLAKAQERREKSGETAVQSLETDESKPVDTTDD